MLEYQKDGGTVKVSGIYGKGRVGQMVVLDNVQLHHTCPLVKYPQPHVFTIAEKIGGGEREDIYILVDQDGNRVLGEGSQYGEGYGGHLYDLVEWVTWMTERTKEKLARKERKIALLEAHLQLLKDILIKQGVRVVSQETAKQLGIT